MTTCRVLYLSDPPIRTQICREFSPTVYFKNHLFQVSFGNSGIHKMVSSRELGPVQNTTMKLSEYRGLYTNWLLTHPHDPPPHPSLHEHIHPHPPTSTQTPFTHYLCCAPNLGSQVDHLTWIVIPSTIPPPQYGPHVQMVLKSRARGVSKYEKKSATGC